MPDLPVGLRYPCWMMKLLVPFALILFACSGDPLPISDEVGSESSVEESVVFENVSIIPMQSDALSNVIEGSVLVRGDRIVEVGPDVEAPAGAKRVDGTNLYLIPGLAEMHGHVPPPSADRQEVEDTLFLYVANGITTVRGMLGAPGQLDLKRDTASGAIIGPTLYLAGPSFNGNSISSPEQAARKVREQKTEGWDLLKVHPGLTRAEYDAMADTAHEVGIRFGGHVPAEVGLLHAIEKGQETFDHLDGYIEQLGPENLDETSMRDLAVRSREAGSWVVPTMALWETILGSADIDAMRSYDELRYVDESDLRQWEDAWRARTSSTNFDAELMRKVAAARIDLLRILNEEDVPILMGTDAPQQFSVPGFSLHRELEWMKRAGMTPLEILESGSTIVGRYFENEDRLGTITPGARADLVLLRANPLEGHEALTEIEGVMIRGRWLSREMIDARLAEIDARRD